jgi:hypothetical protein
LSKRLPELSIRSFREGDEEALARLFNSYTAGYFGPVRVTPRTWRGQFRRQDWKAPSLTDDNDCRSGSDCGRVAESEGRIVGYAITDYQPMWMEDGAVLQELCVVDEDGAAEIMQTLIEDAEKRALARGKSYLALQLSPDDGMATAAGEARGFWTADDGGVFMAYVTDLAGLLTELLPELRQRLADSPLRDWHGALEIASDDQSCTLLLSSQLAELAKDRPKPDPAVGARLAVSVSREALPLLLFGREHIGELYVQGQVSLKAADVEEALRLLHILFPPLPLSLPRAQWW